MNDSLEKISHVDDSLEKISHVDDSCINDNESSNSEKSKEVNDEAFSQGKGLEPRKLTESELERLSRDKELVTPFKQNKLELEAKKNWDLFYRRNKANFFKDRYWTFREFEELNETSEGGENTSEKKILLEIGCGVGNFVYPLLKNNKNIFAYACDFSTDAVQLLKSNSDYDETRINGFVCDITKENLLRESIPKDVYVDIVTLIFVFSAIHPDKMRNAVLNIAKILKPGGVVLVRDYGMNDYSMIRFEPGHKLADGFYARQDGTRSYFFTLEKINQLFTDPFSQSSGDESNQNADVTLFHKSVSEYIFRETVNIKENLRVPRVFVQSKFIRSNTLI